MNGKEKYGQYMTPKLIAEFMVSLITKENEKSVLEPSCGEGVFLEVLREKGFNNLTAYEIDTEIIKGDSDVIYSSFIATSHQDEFSVVIGNPPYIRWKNLEERFKDELKESHLWNKHLNSLSDYSAIFILKSVEALEEDGELIFITPDYWMDTTHSEGLREYLIENGYFEKIILFKEAPIFKGVTVSLMIFKFIKSKHKKNKNIIISKYNKQKEVTEKVLKVMLNNENDLNVGVETFEIKQFEANTQWIIAREEELSLIRLYEESCTKKGVSLFDRKLDVLEDVCDIGNGMVSGLDKAFQVKEGSNLNEDEKRATIEVIKGQHLQQYIFDKTMKYIFITENLSENEFARKYPNFKSMLEPFKEQLEKRYSYNRDIKYWEWVFLRNYNTFKQPNKRIFVPGKERISNRDYVRFAIADSYHYPTQDVTAIIPFNTTKESIEYICSILNSKYVFEWVKHKGVIKGHIVEFSRAPLARIPFRKIDFDSEKEIKIHNEITRLVQEHIKNPEPAITDQINKLVDQLM